MQCVSASFVSLFTFWSFLFLHLLLFVTGFLSIPNILPPSRLFITNWNSIRLTLLQADLLRLLDMDRPYRMDHLDRMVEAEMVRHPGHMERPYRMDHLDRMVEAEITRHPGHMDHSYRMDHLDRMVEAEMVRHLVHMGRPDPLDHPDCMVDPEMARHPGHMDHPYRMDHRDCMVEAEVVHHPTQERGRALCHIDQQY